MLGLFSRKNQDGEVKLPKPKDILQPIGQSLVVDHHQDPDWVWHLKTVTRPVPGGTREEFRVFSAGMAAEQGVSIRDYTSLDGHPGLILYHGWLDKKARELEMFDSKAGTKIQRAS